MIQVGTTTDGCPVLAGVFPLVGTRGLPLDVVLAELTKAGLVVSWLDYAIGAMADCHDPKRIRSRILEAVEDVPGRSHATELATRLDRMFEILLRLADA